MCWHQSFPAVPGVRGSREQLWVHRQPSLPALPTGDNSWCIWWVQGAACMGTRSSFAQFWHSGTLQPQPGAALCPLSPWRGQGMGPRARPVSFGAPCRQI